MKTILVSILMLTITAFHAQTLTYQDVSEDELNKTNSEFKVGQGNPETVLVRTVNRWANKRGYSGYPNFEIGKARVRGVQLLGGAKFRDVPQNELHEVETDFKLNTENDAITWHRAINRWANKHGRAGIPTFEIGSNYTRGVYLIEKYTYFDVSEEELHSVEHRFKIGETNSYEIWARAANRWANKKGYYFGFSNFEIGPNRERGVHCVKNIPKPKKEKIEKINCALIKKGDTKNNRIKRDQLETQLYNQIVRFCRKKGGVKDYNFNIIDGYDGHGKLYLYYNLKAYCNCN